MRFIIIFLFLFFSLSVSAREQLRIVGSATLYPFVTIVAEKFGKISGHTPVVEATGTGGGFRLLCSGNSLNYPDIVNASRTMRSSEKALCKQNSVNNIQQITLGYDGIVIAQSIKAKKIDLSLKQLFLATAKKVPLDSKMVDNPYKTWQDIDPSLPNNKIEIYGPSFTSGTRDAFIELVMHKFCESSDEIVQIIPDANERLSLCSSIREDGHYIDMPENYNLIIQKLLNNSKSFGIISFSLLEDNTQIKPAKIANIAPSKTSIINEKYLLARPLFLYVNRDHEEQLPDLKQFIDYITSSVVIGPTGYLTDKGLIVKRTF